MMSKWLTDEKEVQEIISCADESGEISTEEVLLQARSKSSRLHKYFEWDESEAAKQYNLMQARQLIRRVPVTYIGSDGEKKTVPRLVNISRKEGEEYVRGYVDIGVSANDEEVRKVAMLDAIQRIDHWRNIYESYEELGGIVNAEKLERVRKKIEQE